MHWLNSLPAMFVLVVCAPLTPLLCRPAQLYHNAMATF